MKDTITTCIRNGGRENWKVQNVEHHEEYERGLVVKKKEEMTHHDFLLKLYLTVSVIITVVIDSPRREKLMT